MLAIRGHGGPGFFLATGLTAANSCARLRPSARTRPIGHGLAPSDLHLSDLAASGTRNLTNPNDPSRSAFGLGSVGPWREKDKPMMIALKRISTALGLLAVTSASAWAQGPAPSRNQATADAVAAALSTTANQTGSRLAIETRKGLVTLTGTVANASIKADLVARTLRVTGVTAVNDRLQVGMENPVRVAQYQPNQIAMGHGGGMMGHGGGMMGNGGTVVDNSMGGPANAANAPAYDGPIPEGTAGGVPAASSNMPNYAWPSYAPYPNFSAVGYPTSYPWQAWPNIGPFYPYPEVPLDWRAVTLRWDDGIWWLDFKKHYTRPFFTPYPFGIFGY
jgi:hypothetical protein